MYALLVIILLLLVSMASLLGCLIFELDFFKDCSEEREECRSQKAKRKQIEQDLHELERLGAEVMRATHLSGRPETVQKMATQYEIVEKRIENFQRRFYWSEKYALNYRPPPPSHPRPVRLPEGHDDGTPSDFNFWKRATDRLDSFLMSNREEILVQYAVSVARMTPQKPATFHAVKDLCREFDDIVEAYWKCRTRPGKPIDGAELGHSQEKAARGLFDRTIGLVLTPLSLRDCFKDEEIGWEQHVLMELFGRKTAWSLIGKHVEKEKGNAIAKAGISLGPNDSDNETEWEVIGSAHFVLRL